MMQHSYQDLIHIFNSTFFSQYQTRLVKGDNEPMYLPADGVVDHHRIIFAHGFYASALHEIAHWLLAGSKRRLLEDFGYWYCPDGRDQQQQAAFEQVEVKPQAIEWSLSVAAGAAFNVSCDNLDGAQPDRWSFQARVYRQVAIFLERGYPLRAMQFMTALSEFYGTKIPTCIEQFGVLTARVQDI